MPRRKPPAAPPPTARPGAPRRRRAGAGPEVEFSRPQRVERLPAAGLAVDLAATETECAALARRYGVEAVRALTAALTLTPGRAGTVLVQGTARAALVQTCVVSLEPFETEAVAEFVIRFRPIAGADPAAEALDRGELDPEAEDEEAYADGVIDLGALVAEQVALEIDPYPRRPGAELPGPGEVGRPDATSGAAEEEPARPHPFAGLAALRGRKG